MDKLSFIFIRPSPRHSLQGWVIVCPAPLQSGQWDWTLKNPWARTTWPVPRQVRQVCGECPGLDRDSLQVPHESCFSTSTSFLVPKAASLKLMRISRRRSAPVLSLWFPPPKKSPKISPNWEKISSNPLNPLNPLPFNPSWPNWSYICLFSGSFNTS